MLLERYFAPLMLAAGITFLLFWTMTLLVRIEDRPLEPTPFPVVEIVDVRLDTETVLKPLQPPDRPELNESPTTPPLDPTSPTDPRLIGIPMNEGPGPRGITREGMGLLRPPNGEAVPLVRVPPQYPASALRRGIEGRVLVEFDVGRSGRVENARVIAAEPGTIFNESALRAVREWRYEPRIIDGRAVSQNRLRIQIPFRMEGRKARDEG
jgi:protein TonB